MSFHLWIRSVPTFTSVSKFFCWSFFLHCLTLVILVTIHIIFLFLQPAENQDEPEYKTFHSYLADSPDKYDADVYSDEEIHIGQ